MNGRGRPSLGRAPAVARGEARRTLRSIRESPRELVGTLFVASMVLLFTVGATASAYVFGRGLRSGGPFADWAVLPAARAVAGGAWLFLILALAFRTLAKVGRLERRTFLLSSAPVRDLVAGKLLAESATLACWLAVPVAATSVAFAVGTGAPAAGLALAAVVATLAGSALVAGFVLGIAVKHAATRYEPIVRVKTPLAIVLALAYVGVLVTGRVQIVFELVSGPMRYWPVSWLADALFVPVASVDASPRRAVAGVAFTAALTAGTLALAPRAAGFHWLSDRPRPSTTDSRPTDTVVDAGVSGSSFGSTANGEANTSAKANLNLNASAKPHSRFERLIEPITTRETRAVATVVWRRTVRSPVRLIYLLYPLFFAVEPARRTIESLQATGTVPASVPPLVMAYVVWAAGMAFTLNALGDQGSTLPATLTAPASAGALVRGRMLVAVVATLPLAVVLVGGLALASALSAVAAVGFVLATAVGVVAAVALATGIGVAFPRFGAVSVTRNRTVVVPGKAAAALYSVVALVLAGCLSLVAYEPIAAVVSLALSVVTPLGDVSVPVGALRVAGAVVLAALAVAPVLSYRYAVRRIETYALE